MKKKTEAAPAAGIVELLGKYGAAEGGMTMREICAATGWGVSSARLRVRAAVDAGSMEFCGKKSEPRMDGATMSVPVYRVVKK